MPETLCTGSTTEAMPIKRLFRPQEWHFYRDEIHRIYVENGETLQATMKYMKEVHGFGPSERKFKDKIKEWKFEKYITTAEMKFITAKQQIREKEQGKSTTFYKNSVKVSSPRIKKWEKRKAESSKDLKAADAATPDHISYETPLPENAENSMPEPNNNDDPTLPQEVTKDVSDSCLRSVPAEPPSDISDDEIIELPQPSICLQVEDQLDRSPARSSSIRSQFGTASQLSVQEHLPGPLHYDPVFRWGSFRKDDTEPFSTIDDWDLSELYEDDLTIDGSLQALEKLAQAHKRAGNFAEASKEYSGLMSEYKRSYRSHSPFSLGVLSSLAEIYQTQGLLAKSIATYRQIIFRYERRYGDSSSETLKAVHSLAKVLEEGSHHCQAEVLYKRAIAGFEALGEAEVAHKLNSQVYLADMLHDLDYCEEAKPLLDSAVTGYNKLGVAHLELIALGSLLELDISMKNWSKIIPTTKRMQSLIENRLLDNDNQCTETLVEGIHLAEVYCDLGCHNLAESLLALIIPKLEALNDDQYSIEKIYGYLQCGSLHQKQRHWKEASDYLGWARDGLNRLDRHYDEVTNMVDARRMEVHARSNKGIGQHANSTLSEEKLEQLVRAHQRRQGAGVEAERISSKSKSTKTGKTESSSASCKYGLTYSVSEITGVSISEFLPIIENVEEM